MVDETLSLFEPQLKGRRIAIVNATATGLRPQALGHRGRLQQVLLNLLLNARDALPTGGRINIATTVAGDQVALEVADTGAGIPPEHLDRIYDPFFTTKGAGEGTGLGLSVTYGIVRDHGGTITVDSRPGDGSRFQVRLPAWRAAKVSA
jgi:signal transduction histidine kinase